jgi:hypothetical protein
MADISRAEPHVAVGKAASLMGRLARAAEVADRARLRCALSVILNFNPCLRRLHFQRSVSEEQMGETRYVGIMNIYFFWRYERA